MAAPHTPAPWFVDGPAENQIVWSDAENRICFMAHSDGATPDRDRANGRLVAEAPNMFAALKWAERFLSGFEDDEYQGIDDDLNDIRAIISRIESEQ